MFMLGWNKPLLAEIERRAGPTTCATSPASPEPERPSYTPARAGGGDSSL